MLSSRRRKGRSSSTLLSSRLLDDRIAPLKPPSTARTRSGDIICSLRALKLPTTSPCSESKLKADLTPPSLPPSLDFRTTKNLLSRNSPSSKLERKTSTIIISSSSATPVVVSKFSRLLRSVRLLLHSRLRTRANSFASRFIRSDRKCR